MKKAQKMNKKERWNQFVKIYFLVMLVWLSIGYIKGTNNNFENIVLILAFVIWAIDVILSSILEIQSAILDYKRFKIVLYSNNCLQNIHWVAKNSKECMEKSEEYKEYILRYGPKLLDSQYLTKQNKQLVKSIISKVQE